MKKVYLLLTVSFLFIYGCEKEDIDLQNSSFDNQETVLKEVAFYASNIDGTIWSSKPRKVLLEELYPSLKTQTSLKANSNSSKANSNSSANGHFTSQSGAVTTFSVMENNDGTSGEIKFKNGDFKLLMDSWCINVVDNRAVYSGNIISVENAPCAGAGCPFVIGNALYWSVEDNGEGANAPTDRYFNNFLVVPSGAGPVCYDLTPSFYEFIFVEIFGCGSCGYVDTTGNGDQIQIK